MIIAVDFDGTICTDEYPKIGSPNKFLIAALIEAQHQEAKIILWTCRSGDQIKKAVDWCEKYGLIFDAVNENVEEAIQKFGGDSRKIYADLYIDDKASPFIDLVRDI